MYGYKTKVSVFPAGRFFSSPHERGSAADISISRGHMDWYDGALTNNAQEQNVEEGGLLQKSFLAQWAVLVDKRDQRFSDQTCADNPKRKPKGGRFSFFEN